VLLLTSHFNVLSFHHTSNHTMRDCVLLYSPFVGVCMRGCLFVLSVNVWTTNLVQYECSVPVLSPPPFIMK